MAKQLVQDEATEAAQRKAARVKDAAQREATRVKDAAHHEAARIKQAAQKAAEEERARATNELQRARASQAEADELKEALARERKAFQTEAVLLKVQLQAQYLQLREATRHSPR